MRTGRGRGMPADQNDPLLGCLLDGGSLFIGVDRTQYDHVGLRGDGLIDGTGPPRDGALPVKGTDGPPDLSGRFLDALADPLGAAVALVRRDVDDRLPLGSPRPSRRPVPGRVRLGDL